MTDPYPNPAAVALRGLLARPGLVMMPCCYDALSARLIQQAGFEVTFLSGFAASASRIGAPDLGLMSFGEVRDQARNVLEAVDIPMMVDGDTGYGNAMNVMRTVEGFARAGCAGVMIEDQVAPKRCGHTQGKSVVDRCMNWTVFARRSRRAGVRNRHQGAHRCAAHPRVGRSDPARTGVCRVGGRDDLCRGTAQPRRNAHNLHRGAGRQSCQYAGRRADADPAARGTRGIGVQGCGLSLGHALGCVAGDGH